MTKCLDKTRHMMSVKCRPYQVWQQWHSVPLGNRAIVSGGNVFWTPLPDRLTLFSLERDGISVDRPVGINWQTPCTPNSNKTREPMKSIGIASLLQISCLDSKCQNEDPGIQFNCILNLKFSADIYHKASRDSITFWCFAKYHGAKVQACRPHHFRPALPGWEWSWVYLFCHHQYWCVPPTPCPPVFSFSFSVH